MVSDVSSSCTRLIEDLTALPIRLASKSKHHFAMSAWEAFVSLSFDSDGHVTNMLRVIG